VFRNLKGSNLFESEDFYDSTVHHNHRNYFAHILGCSLYGSTGYEESQPVSFDKIDIPGKGGRENDKCGDFYRRIFNSNSPSSAGCFKG